MSVTACDAPRDSALDPVWVSAAHFKDAYRAPLTRPNLDALDLYLAIFAHRPWWMTQLLLARNAVMRLAGLEVSTPAELVEFPGRDAYAVGGKIGGWLIFHLSETEVIAGRNNSHLDFRVSVLKAPLGDDRGVTASTVCAVHNRFGRHYLVVIEPFHRWGVRALMARAVAAGRL